MAVSIRRAEPCEHERLTSISFAAKRHWSYPQEYFDIWKDELTISEKYIEDNAVFVAELGGEPIAYYLITQVQQTFFAGEIKVEKGYWLEHMFVLPNVIGKGIGRAMYVHAMQFCRDNDIDALRIFADPNAAGFYEKMGACYIEERPSSIAGRTVILFVQKV